MDDISQSATFTCQRSYISSNPTGSFPVCFFCGESSGDFHKVSTLRLDARVRKCAMLLQDINLLGKLSSGDMIAQDTVYHAKCLLTLYRNADAVNMLGA